MRAAGWTSTANTSEMRLCRATQSSPVTNHKAMQRAAPPRSNGCTGYAHHAVSCIAYPHHMQPPQMPPLGPTLRPHLQRQCHDLLLAVPQRVRDALRLNGVVALEVQQRVAAGNPWVACGGRVRHTRTFGVSDVQAPAAEQAQRSHTFDSSSPAPSTTCSARCGLPSIQLLAESLPQGPDSPLGSHWPPPPHPVP